MKPWFKIVLYVALLLITLWAATGFYSSWRASTDATAPSDPATPGEITEPAPRKHNTAAQGKMILYGGILLAGIVGLGLLLSRDVSGWFVSKTTELIYNDNLEGVHNPDYDHAEHVALSGDHLEAVRLLRAFLKKNPREIYAQIRIAELYENELQNPLAAALEYEEVLSHRFNGDRWGWAAIHLVNLYSGKLNKQEQALAWLKRIATEHPATGPAKKAKDRLADLDPTFVADAPATSAAAPPPPSNLPPGFSPKKRG
ncbi:MAG: hypothetical protein FJ405_01250 [Verrucomicrobia bacterium]|nr:hypothetical protein [Verrucomicrobiota bacterium]